MLNFKMKMKIKEKLFSLFIFYGRSHIIKLFVKIYSYKVFFEHVINKLSTLFQHYFNININNCNINVSLINFQYCFNIILTLFQQLQYKYVINKLLTLF